MTLLGMAGSEPLSPALLMDALPPGYRGGDCPLWLGVSGLNLSLSGAGIAQLVVLGLAAKVSRVRYSSGDIFR